jgi:hypothetical protein
MIIDVFQIVFSSSRSSFKSYIFLLPKLLSETTNSPSLCRPLSNRSLDLKMSLIMSIFTHFSPFGSQGGTKVIISLGTILVVSGWNLWSTYTPQIRCVPVSDMHRRPTPTRSQHKWLHWIMSFSQIIGAGVSVSVSLLHRLKYKD